MALDEVDARTLESRRCAGLYFCGEMLDAFGPIGGHNFAWAWATGRAAGLAAGAPQALAGHPRHFRHLPLYTAAMRYRTLALAALISFGSIAANAQAPAQPAASGYLLPPKAIVDILDAPPPPTVELSPSRDVVALLDRASMPTIAQLSQPMHRVAGVRINPKTNGPHRPQLSRATHAEVDRRRARSARDGAAESNAVLDRFLARRQALRVYAAARQRHRAVDRRFCHRAGQVDHAGATQRRPSATPCEWVGDGALDAVRIHRARPRCCADDGGADRSQHPGTSRRHRARPHLSGPVDQRA